MSETTTFDWAQAETAFSHIESTPPKTPRLSPLIKSHGKEGVISVIVDENERLPRDPVYAEIKDESGHVERLGHVDSNHFGSGEAHLFSQAGSSVLRLAIIDREKEKKGVFHFLEVPADKAVEALQRPLGYLDKAPPAA